MTTGLSAARIVEHLYTDIQGNVDVMTIDVGQNLATLSLSSSFGYGRCGKRREADG